jgi:hypothetical protein
MLQRKSRCVSGTIKSEIFARKESMVRYLLLESDRIEAVDELPARYRVRAKISALRRNVVKRSTSRLIGVSLSLLLAMMAFFYK